MDSQLGGLLQRLGRWQIWSAEYDYKVKYRPGATDKVADGVSCLRSRLKLQNFVDGEVSESFQKVAWAETKRSSAIAKPLKFLEIAQRQKPERITPAQYFL